MSLELRIGSGKYRGRVIPVPPMHGRQPRAFTPALVKEALFQILANKGAGPEAGFAFFDLCAGSGQILLEALSRGYAPLHACEPDRRRFAALARTLKAFEEPALLHARDLRRCAGMLLDRGRSIAYLDPPYSFWEGALCGPVTELLKQVLLRLRDSDVERLLVLVQGPTGLELPPEVLSQELIGDFEVRRYRGTTLSILECSKGS